MLIVGFQKGIPATNGTQDLARSLRAWAFSELFFALESSQKGVEDGFKAYQGLQKHTASCSVETHEQHLRVAQQALRHRAVAPLGDAASSALRTVCEDHFRLRCSCGKRSLAGRVCTLVAGHTENHRSTFRPTRVCLCGKSQVSRPDSFEAPSSPELGLPTASCCHDVRFLPFLPLNVDFVADPVLVPTSPRLARLRQSQQMRVLPSALPDANGFVALVADPPVKCDPVDGARLPGFTESFQHLSRWRLPSDVHLNGNSPTRCAYLGLEYLCPQGQRFFVPPLKNSGLVLTSTAAMRASRREKRRRERARDTPQELLMDEGEFEVAPLCAYRLYAPCVRHKKEGSRDPCVAQLSRLWIQTPPAGRGEIIEAAPRVSIADSTRGRGVDGLSPEVVCTGGKVALPHDSLVQLVLPTSYMSRESDGRLVPLPGFWDLDRSDAERCRLLPYTFWISRPS